ncbi:23S rRNA (pseudouridine(1915)-N(3))-methyltransferase RlmH [Malaciobacter marinus]|uniref:Ribosomal RNA large subunit methyltransferase H n=1 Tax=Malaciobacter marinus TaxID=505249 RepID=A0A347TIC3_9BACT|nr:MULTISPECIES: 23S rRNA (pseudouridine(1915)-N(3))-methyltransferase RlmH [Malaciobacter]AXX86351.1 SPOUT methyltransferase [Malaciobacter marinus]PHO11552.1 23S rRNA (pseudouridine(1915)-N(3))-methyltransferase RlmH [Malaciobacter marinus]PHO14920.1 23S rRNA (pseudouridine(1915)-N(3))-methyltransferase RlmH [Malaciobacter marinus]RYA22462.1 23S rRNA (pseudouridine(1915)-N(3))-methyltransferase RlmH [Malaciobacter halophilus]
MKINIYSIMKPSNDEFDKLTKEFIKMSLKYAKVEIHYIFNKKIAKAQTLSEDEAKKSYSEVYEPHLKNSSLNIALDVLGKKIDSFKFSKIFDNNSEINFFIGGAFGFEKEFLNKCDTIISLSELTMAHKIAHLVLIEQVFRGLCIKNNHPYHK